MGDRWQSLPAAPLGGLLLLGEYAPGAAAEIPDPYGMTEQFYEQTYRMISAAVEALIGRVLAGNPTRVGA